MVHAGSVRRGTVRTAVFAVVVVASSACDSDRVDFSATASPPTAAASTTAAAATTTTAIATTSSAVPTAADRQALLDAKRVAFGAPGAVAVVRLGDTEWRGTSGVADLEGTALTDESRFRVGSISKTVVAALVLDEVGRGDLTLDDQVADLLPGVLDADPPTSLRMLLDHTSGIFNVGDEGNVLADIENLKDPAMHAEAAELAQRYLAGEHVLIPATLSVALAEMHERYFTPGTGYHYSNINYQLAAMVLEHVTGLTLDELVRTRIVEPLGLTHTTLAPFDIGSPEMRSYSLDATDGSLHDLTDDMLSVGNGGSGGIVSTAGELLTIMQAIVSGRLLPTTLVAEMKDPTTQSGHSYGLGLATYHLSCGTFLGHGGAIDGTESIAIVSPDGTDGVAAAINLRTDTDPNLLALAESLICPR